MSERRHLKHHPPPTCAAELGITTPPNGSAGAALLECACRAAVGGDTCRAARPATHGFCANTTVAGHTAAWSHARRSGAPDAASGGASSRATGSLQHLVAAQGATHDRAHSLSQKGYGTIRADPERFQSDAMRVNSGWTTSLG